MKIVELRKKSKNELEKLLKDHKDRLGILKFTSRSGTKNVKEMSQLKKDIARILTLFKENK
jgi:ribosomal protein L29